MRFVSLREYLEATVPAGCAARGRGEAPPACAPACEAWEAEFERLFPAAPEEAPGVDIHSLCAQVEAGSADEARRRRLEALLKLAALRREAERAGLLRQGEEVKRLVVTFNEALVALASGGQDAATRFRRVEASLERAARLDNPAAVRGCLQETIQMIRDEVQAQEAETAARVAEFEAELVRARSHLPGAVGKTAGDRREACELIRRQLGGEARGNFAATVVVFDRVAAARARFGAAMTAEALGAFARARAADSAAGGMVYRWNEQALFWEAKQWRDPAELRSEMESVLGKAFDYKTVVGGRPAVLSLSGRWLCAFPEEGGAEALIEEIDRFTGGEAA
jgi:hypothetical protein